MIFINNTIRIEPKVYTSIKSNGRWGDVVASLFPVFWCSNILVNSIFLIRTIEKQTETGVFVIRVRGKQWYWVYKMSVNFKKHTNNVNLVIGRGNKINATYGLYTQHPDNYAIPSSRWGKKIKKYMIINKKIQNKSIFITKKAYNTPHILMMYNKLGPLDVHKFVLDLKINQFKTRVGLTQLSKHDKYYLRKSKRKLLLHKAYKCSNNKLFNLDFETYHGYRYYNRFFYSIQQQPKKVWKSLKTNNIVHFNTESSYDLLNRRKVTLNKIKPINNKKTKKFIRRLRMISTHNTLILPTKVNITLITNSFDVVHSWFIPGLGVKFDCVPGRSTHYSIRIKKPGIYYGHCAEVCGRFHHHMPIKVIAVPLHHFSYYYNMYYKM